MFIHKWMYQGKVIRIIDSQTIVVWVDLGFDIWKKVVVRFNRIKVKGAYLGHDSEIRPVLEFLDQNLRDKQVYTQIFKQKDFNGFDRFFAEIYTKPADIQLKLKDINRAIGTKNRIDGLISINDILVSQGFATYIQFNNGTQNGPAHQENSRGQRLTHRSDEKAKNETNIPGEGPVAEVREEL